MGVGEASAFLGEAIDVGGADFGGTVAGEVAVAEVIGVDEDDVGFVCGEGGEGAE